MPPIRVQRRKSCPRPNCSSLPSSTRSSSTVNLVLSYVALPLLCFDCSVLYCLSSLFTLVLSEFSVCQLECDLRSTTNIAVLECFTNSDTRTSLGSPEVRITLSDSSTTMTSRAQPSHGYPARRILSAILQVLYCLHASSNIRVGSLDDSKFERVDDATAALCVNARTDHTRRHRSPRDAPPLAHERTSARIP